VEKELTRWDEGGVVWGKPLGRGTGVSHKGVWNQVILQAYRLGSPVVSGSVGQLSMRGVMSSKFYLSDRVWVFRS